MERDLLEAWNSDLYWIALKYDLDPTDYKVRDFVEEVFECGWMYGGGDDE